MLPLQRCLWFTCSRPASVLFKPPSPRTKHRKVSRHAEKALQCWGLPCLGLPKAAWDSFAAAWARVLGAAWGGFLGFLEWQAVGGSHVEAIEAFGGSHFVALGKEPCACTQIVSKGPYYSARCMEAQST